MRQRPVSITAARGQWGGSGVRSACGHAPRGRVSPALALLSDPQPRSLGLRRLVLSLIVLLGLLTLLPVLIPFDTLPCGLRLDITGTHEVDGPA